LNKPTEPSNRASKNYLYHTNPPEVIREQLRERKERDPKGKRTRRIVFWTLLFNLVILFAIFGVVFLSGQRGRKYEYIQNVSPFVLRISAASEYVYGEVPEIVIRISNSSSSLRECLIEKFEFYVKSETKSGENLFTFVYPPKNTFLLDRYDSRSVYDFKRDNPSYELQPGTYYVVCRFVVNDTPVELSKPFTINEVMSTTLFFRDDFWTPDIGDGVTGSVIDTYIRIQNSTPKSLNYRFGVYNLKITESGNTVEGVKEEVPQKEVFLASGEALDIPLKPIPVPERVGDYLFEWSFFVDDRLQEGQNQLLVRELTPLEAPEKLRILSYSVKTLAMGEPYQSEILLANDLNDTLFLRLEDFAFYIYRDRTELYRYQSERTLQVLVPARSTRTIFRSEEWKEIRFDRPGTYVIRTTLKTNAGEKVFEEEITVLEKTDRSP